MSVLQELDQNRKKLSECSEDELYALGGEIRALITDVVEKNGGHLSSNLGVVDLTIALNYVFNAQQDKMIFDVGHQCYAHKILNGRLDQFETLRRAGGISGFPDRAESAADSFTAGHSSTSLSAALGLAVARDLSKADYRVVAVIGDGALTGGMAYEALNQIGELGPRMLIVLNDNEMSIGKNVGSMAKHLGKLRLSKRYLRFKRGLDRFCRHLPLLGKPLRYCFVKCRGLLRHLLMRHIPFENYNIKYVGSIDGHNIREMIRIMEQTKLADGPVLLHVTTQKGYGNESAEKNPNAYHGVKPGLICQESAFSKAAGQALCGLAEKDERICAITAAMTDGTGLRAFSEKFPSRFFDVGIAEEHAATFAAGLADGGMKPYFAVYSTFLQRAYDQVMLDCCLNSLPVTFLVDRAGLTGSDGKTHQGIYDACYLTQMPGLTVLCPRDLNALERVIKFSAGFGAPLAIRYGNSYSGELAAAAEDLFRWEVLREGTSGTILTYSNTLIHLALRLAERMEREGISLSVVDAKCLKPLDSTFLDSCEGRRLLVLEDCVCRGSLGEAVAAYFAEKELSVKLRHCCIVQEFVPHGTVDEQLEWNGMGEETLCRELHSLCG